MKQDMATAAFSEEQIIDSVRLCFQNLLTLQGEHKNVLEGLETTLTAVKDVDGGNHIIEEKAKYVRSGIIQLDTGVKDAQVIVGKQYLFRYDILSIEHCPEALCRLIDWLIDWLVYWLIDWLIGFSSDWLIDWLIDWLTRYWTYFRQILGSKVFLSELLKSFIRACYVFLVTLCVWSFFQFLVELKKYLDTLEADKAKLKAQVRRLYQENAWLREELSSTQLKLQASEQNVVQLETEKQQLEFMNQLKKYDTGDQVSATSAFDFLSLLLFCLQAVDDFIDFTTFRRFRVLSSPRLSSLLRPTPGRDQTRPVNWDSLMTKTMQTVRPSCSTLPCHFAFPWSFKKISWIFWTGFVCCSSRFQCFPRLKPGIWRRPPAPAMKFPRAYARCTTWWFSMPVRDGRGLLSSKPDR